MEDSEDPVELDRFRQRSGIGSSVDSHASESETLAAATSELLTDSEVHDRIEAERATLETLSGSEEIAAYLARG